MRILLNLITLVFMAQTLCAQDYSSPQISVSTEKIKENGVVKYVHHVKQKETLYALAKAYGVTSEEIIKHNPNLKSGLRAGMIVFIPVVTTQTVPQTATGESAEAPAAANNGKEYRKHTAKWYETLEDIAAVYQVSVADIMALNKLKTIELSRRQVLLIPNKKAVAAESVTTTVATPVPMEKQVVEATTLPVTQTTGKQEQMAQIVNPETLQPISTSGEMPLNRPEKRFGNYGPVEISMILPLNGSDSTALNYNFMDFYAGALLAVNKLKEEGVDMKINVFDQSATSIHSILSSGRLNSSELIVGPVRGADVKEVLRYARNTGIPVISPMDQQAEQYLSENPSFIQVPSLSEVQMKNLLKQLYHDYNTAKNGTNVLLCSEKGGADTAAVRIATEYLNKYQIPYTTITYSILEGRGMLYRIKSAMDYTKSNLVVVPSNSEAFVNDLVRNLNLCLAQDKESNPDYMTPKNLIHLYGLPKWKNFETIEPEHFHKMNLCLSLPYHIDYNREEVKEFLLKFRALYKTEPSPYAFQGYDIMRYFIPQLRNYGKEFVNVMQLENGQMLQSDYSFSRERFSDGFGNQATRTIKYNPDFSITTSVRNY